MLLEMSSEPRQQHTSYHPVVEGERRATVITCQEDVHETDVNHSVPIQHLRPFVLPLRLATSFGLVVVTLMFGILVGGLFVYVITKPVVEGFDWGETSCDKSLGKLDKNGHRVSTTALCSVHPAAMSAPYNSSQEEAFMADVRRSGMQNSRTDFMVLGDWGRDGWCCQHDVAYEMDRIARQQQAAFVISVGDNFYPFGLSDASAEQVSTSFRNVYNTNSLAHLQSLNWYAVLGNHDYRGLVNAQFKLTELQSNWVMPARNYASKFADGLLEIFFIDTNPMIKAYLDDPTINKESNDFIRLASETAQHLSTLNDTLRASTAKWKIVVGHHPIFTAGTHHAEVTGDPTQPLRHGLRNVLEENHVVVYFAGHDHDQQHIKQDGNRLHYVVSGAGSSVRSLREFELGVQFFSTTQGFVWATVTPDMLRVRFVDSVGNVMYAFQEAHV